METVGLSEDPYQALATAIGCGWNASLGMWNWLSSTRPGLTAGWRASAAAADRRQHIRAAEDAWSGIGQEDLIHGLATEFTEDS